MRMYIINNVFVAVVSDVFTSPTITDVTTSQYHDVAVYSSTHPLTGRPINRHEPLML